MKKYFLMAVLVMVCVCGFAQESAEVVSSGTELAVTADGKKVKMWDLKVDEATGDVSFVISLDGGKAGDLWSWCRMWLAENVAEYNRIKQIEDKAEGRLVVNFTAPIDIRAKDGEWDTKWKGSQTWKMTIQCKDERYRVRMTEYTSKWSAQALIMGSWSAPLDQVNKSYQESASRMKTPFAGQYKDVIDSVIASQGAYIKKMSDEDDDF